MKMVNGDLKPSEIVGWVLGSIFLTLGILNAVLVHAVPGAFYILIAFLYLPPTYSILEKRIGFTIPFVAKVILAFVILWGTLAVTDLAEILGL